MEKMLCIKGLSKSFGKSLILDKVNLNVYKGEVMGFLGPNGAGKSTVIKTALGFLTPDEGEIEIDGIPVKKNYERAMAKVGGIVENPDMYKNLSGMLNLQMYARTHEGITQERINEVVEMVGLTYRINDKVKRYSLGMKQRLGLAQAILHKPSLLFLDEPTNGLDPAGIKELRDILKRLAHEEGVAILVSSHQLAEMEQMCDRITIIVQGKIVCEKTVTELEEEKKDKHNFFLKSGCDEVAMQVLSYFSPTIDPITRVITFISNKDDIPEIVKALVQYDVPVYELVEEKTSLEDAFIAITQGEEEEGDDNE